MFEKYQNGQSFVIEMNNIEMLTGETMFEYLKRKKKVMLEHTLSRNKGNHGSEDQLTGRQDRETDFEKTKRNQSKENIPKLTSKIKDSHSITPKRISILEQEKRPATRSFLQMISPIRSKSPIQNQVENSMQKSPTFQKKKSVKQNYTKKVLMEKISSLQQLLQSLVKSGKRLKQKSHFLFVDLRPFFRHLQTCEESTFQRKTENIKAQLKALETVFGDFKMESVQESFDSFYLILSQYINELDGISQAELKENKASFMSEVITTKQTQITELQEQNKKLERDLQNWQKKYQKLETNFDSFKLQTFSKLEASNHEQIEKYKHYETCLQEEVLRNSHLTQQIEDMEIILKQKESQLKKLMFDHEKYKQESLNTITKVKSEQQEFLLNEIIILKQQFNSDITQMSKLHKIKEEEYIARINDYAFQLQKVKKKIEDLTMNSIEMEETSNSSKAQATRFKKQNEILAIDMHRINEQLYQHWLALKDIKTLALRLDIFHKFKKIYQELLFNEQLFM